MKLIYVYITCGPSGSGKTSFYEQVLDPRFYYAKLISPDDIRKELTGDINNQTENKNVWMLAYERFKKELKNQNSVYFSATSCYEKNIETLLLNVKEVAMNNDQLYQVEILKFPLVSTFTLKLRVLKDLLIKRDRSNTLKIIKKNGIFRTVIGHQNHAYKKLFKVLEEYQNNPSYLNDFIKKLGLPSNVFVRIEDVCKGG